jgi:putative phosphoesterase
VRIGLISDLHGNPLALEAALAELERAAVDELVCLGDVAPGPEPVETIRRLREAGCPVVCGNWDAWLVDEIPLLPPPVGDKLREQGAWWSAQLSQEERDYLRSLPPAVEIGTNGDSVLCVHGSPRAHTDDIHATTPDEALAAMLGGREPLVLATGHTHVELVRVHGSTLIVNPGSVGLPFHTWPPPNGDIRMSPWAECAIVSVEDGIVSTELRRVPYDVRPLLDSAVASGMPHARWWADSWLTLPARFR